jgi:threonine/homoserine/homoserine lactone efflux protein
MLAWLVKGFILGFSIAAPVGPIGVLCIRRTVAHGRAVGLASGMGAAVADAMYGAVAGFGLAAVSSALVGMQFWLRLVGGLFLCYLGYRTLRTAPSDAAAPRSSSSVVGAFFSTLGLTLTNPMTILSFGAVFAGLGVATGRRSYGDSGALVLGVLLGSAAWWMTLSGLVSRLRGSLNPKAMRAINIASGIVLIGFGIAAVIASGSLQRH